MKFYRILLAAFSPDRSRRWFAAQPGGAGLPAGVARVTSVEGVTEYRLAKRP